ncbi:EAL domain-containing protein [Chitinibacter bivalviorum]|uniref:EAL domain-containing protein n=1 Tax=Chitinibacter bivalviorum TaxID=2739434 RepID=A0A7H9BKV2_9NEIS|nr:EAL domain-containing protein [Chitinibacter bivalviorum]QLG89129.1 EAL domain-containing protein [Chitinibacter bivalviorum]
MCNLSASLLLDVLGQQRFGVEYQPLIHTGTGDIVAYEALARFYDQAGATLRTDHVFHALHDSPLTLFQAEYQMKRLQIDFAPAGTLFLNLDPDAYTVAMQNDDTHPLLDLICPRRDVVLEIIENSDLSDARQSARMADAFAQRQVRLALDDIGAPHSMLSLPLLIQVDCLKFDRSWLSQLDCPLYRAALLSLITYARETGKQTVMEGIETDAQLALARSLGVDLVQGFLYRPLFIVQQA